MGFICGVTRIPHGRRLNGSSGKTLSHEKSVDAEVRRGRERERGERERRGREREGERERERGERGRERERERGRESAAQSLG